MHSTMPVPFATVPAEHSVQLVAPVKAVYLPPSQSMQLDCPDAIWYLPVSQEAQEVIPVVFAIMPAVQTVHVSAAASEYFPSSHALQDDAPDPL